MGNKFSKGDTFADGETVSAARLNNLVDLATPTVNFITDQTASPAPVAGDKYFVYNAAAGGLRQLDHSLVSSTILASATAPATTKQVSQVAHGFAVGDIIGYDKVNGKYSKVKATYLEETFATGVVATATDRITLSSGAVGAMTNGDRIFFTSSSALPAALVSSKFYYVSKSSATEIQVYTETGLVNLVDFTDQGTGTHTIHYGLNWANDVGVVSVLTDANTFTVSFSGEITTLSGLTAGQVYYLSQTSAGATVTVPPTAEGHLTIPVYVATSATSAIIGIGATFPSPYSIREGDIAPQAVTRSKLSSTLQQTIDRNVGAERQMILSASTDASGYHNSLSTSAGLVVDLTASVTPMVVAFANGFDDVNGYNYVEKITSNQTFTVPANREANFLYIDRNTSTGALTYLSTANPPEYGFAKSVYRDRGLMPKLSSNGGNADYVVDASSAVQPAWKAFDKVNATFWQSTATASEWLRVHFGGARVINAVTIYIDSSAATAPSTFSLQGSNDGTAWTPITSFGPQAWTPPQAITFQATNTTAYTWYRLLFATANGGGHYSIMHVDFHEAIDHYYVIPESTMYSYSGTWTKVNRVFVGECKSGATTISSVTNYAIRGQYASDIFDLTPSTDFNKSHNIGTPATTLHTRQRFSVAFPWTGLSLLDPTVGGGLGVTMGQSDRDPKGDRNVASLFCGAFTTVGSLAHPARYSDDGSGALTFGQAQVFVRRAF